MLVPNIAQTGSHSCMMLTINVLSGGMIATAVAFESCSMEEMGTSSVYLREMSLKGSCKASARLTFPIL